ncbi:hypothetical protein [Ktedonospora formicarum]|uniref:hypothetical protein n=1 Tax=Ktedonospora formicarum TaxID=2778364 RepID=UPI001C68C7EA|nr:hypothetical protein [Ktedonospora formicarum]
MSSYPTAGTFDPETLAKQVPPTGLRYLRHAIRPGRRSLDGLRLPFMALYDSSRASPGCLFEVERSLRQANPST